MKAPEKWTGAARRRFVIIVQRENRCCRIRAMHPRQPFWPCLCFSQVGEAFSRYTACNRLRPKGAGVCELEETTRKRPTQ
jgi:hypothetical protein